MNEVKKYEAKVLVVEMSLLTPHLVQYYTSLFATSKRTGKAPMNGISNIMQYIHSLLE